MRCLPTNQACGSIRDSATMLTKPRESPPGMIQNPFTQYYQERISTGDVSPRPSAHRRFVGARNAQSGLRAQLLLMYTAFDAGCFDYGNSETNNRDDGCGTMEAICEDSVTLQPCLPACGHTSERENLATHRLLLLLLPLLLPLPLSLLVRFRQCSLARQLRRR
eukprot:SAG31_NODE_3931_length_3742_cov_2.127917_2_plen_164_part_00